MRVIFYDLVQVSDAPAKLKSPALADVYTAATSFNINLVVVPEDPGAAADAIGVGNTDAATITVNGDVITLDSVEKTGLYLLPNAISLGSPDDFFLLAEDGSALLTEFGDELLVESLSYSVSVSHDGSFIGRLALGKGHALYAAPSHEPGFYSTAQNRVTASGQIVPGAGGYSGRRISLDFRYKFTQAIIEDIQAAYAAQLSRGYPLFIWFDKESRMPWTRMYGGTDPDYLFQSSINRYLYSKRLEFVERY